MNHQSHSRCELIYRIAHELTETVRFLPVRRYPVRLSAVIGTLRPDFDIFHLVGYLVLDMCKLEAGYCRRGGNVP